MARKKAEPVVAEAPVEEEAETPPTPEEEDGRKEPRIYKGSRMAVTKLGPGMIVQSLPGTRDQNNGRGYGQGRLPLFMIVDAVQAYSGTTKYLVFKDPRQKFQARGFELPSNFEVNVLSGRMKTALEAEILAHKESQIGVLPWPGGYLGTDPELFVVNEKGVIIPAFEFLGSKKTPNLVDRNMARQGDVYWDGFQAEFTTEATNCLMEQTYRIAAGLQTVHMLARQHNPKAKLSIESVLPVPDGLLESSKEEHVEFGCAPSINAYGLSGNTAEGRRTLVRMAGGHLHLGIGASRQGADRKTLEATYPAIIKSMDKVLGVACVSLFEGYDSPMRRQYYGLPGEYRTPPHGIEYRTLSNAWLIHPLITNVVFEMARRSIAMEYNGVGRLWNAAEEETVEVIRENDVAGARKILKRNERVFKNLMSTHTFASSIEKLWNLVTQGMGGFLKHPRDIAPNWGLADDNKTFNKQYRLANWGHCEPELPGKV